MKKLAYFILGLGLGFLACKFLFQTESPKETEEVTIVKPKGVISPARAMTLDKNFNERHEAMSNVIGKPDNRSSWYSFEDMENYLAYTKNQTDSLGYSIDGIRIYFAAYGDKEYSTLFLVPTGTKKTAKGQNNFLPPTSGDIPGAGVLNDGSDGHPPSANYPQ